ncbi:MAG TPA: hypothetical protein PKU94_08950 [Candidatus Hydrothermia bacterium]|nr:hypothetical protein [Candidatus Hydrothermia bacterium]
MRWSDFHLKSFRNAQSIYLLRYRVKSFRIYSHDQVYLAQILLAPLVISKLQELSTLFYSTYEVDHFVSGPPTKWNGGVWEILLGVKEHFIFIMRVQEFVSDGSLNAFYNRKWGNKASVPADLG